MRVFQGASADEVWLAAVADVESWSIQTSRSGDTRETLRAAFVIENPRRRWVTSRSPAISPALGIAEIAWILAGDDALDYLTPWSREHAKFVGDSVNVYGAYGLRLRKSFGVDQIIRAAEALRSAPDSRQVVLQIYEPRLDLPNDAGAARSADVPCNVTSMLKIRKGRLEWTQILRSNDLHRGVPYNFLQFTTLQEVVAGLAGVEVGTYAHFSDSLHVYERELRYAVPLRPTTEFEDVADLRVRPEDFDRHVVDFHSCVGSLGRALSDNAIDEALKIELEPGWRDMVLVCASERARRLGHNSLAVDLLSRCSSETMKEMQYGYSKRFIANSASSEG